MALTYSIIGRGSIGNLGIRVVDITLDNAYAAGGWALTAKDLGFGTNGQVLGVIPMGGAEQGRILEWDQANNKLLVRDASGAANAASPEITTLTQMNGFVCRVVVLGIGSG
jgi:hypothetical protein